MTHRYIKHTKEELEPIVLNSLSMRQVLLSLGLKITGGNRCHIENVIKKFSIDTSHFLGQGSSHGIISTNRKKPEEYLTKYDKSYPISTDSIKKKMFRDNVKEKKCEICNRRKWQGKEIPLELHHKDGDRWNNLLENLFIVCCNCHAQTEGYSKNGLKKTEKKKYYCPNCGGEKSRKSPQCIKCNNINRRKIANRPEKEILLREVEKNGYVKTGKKYGVSDNTIRKWLQ